MHRISVPGRAVKVGRQRAVLMALLVLCGSWLFMGSEADASWRRFKRNWPKLWIQSKPCEVYKVIDGDTVHVYCDGKKEKLRLVGIDTPETKHPFKPIEYYGPQASARAKGLMPKGSKVWLGFARRGARGKYGRLLAFLFLPSKGMFNALMVREGYAMAMRRYPNVYKSRFIALENQAKRKRRGMWADPGKVRAMMAGDRRYRDHKRRCVRKLRIRGRFNWVIGDSAQKRYYTRRNGGLYFRTNPNTRILFCSVSEAEQQGYTAATGSGRRYRRRRNYRRRGGDNGGGRRWVARGGRKLIIGDKNSQRFFVFKRGSYQVFRSIREAKEAGYRRARKRRRRSRRARRRKSRRARRGRGGGSAQKPNCGGKTPIVSNRRSKKYRLPSQRSYKRATRSKNAVYFCTEQEAINAGHTKAKR